MSTAAQVATGSTLKYSVDDGANWVKLPEAETAPVPEEDQDWEEATTLDSGGAKEWVPGLVDSGELEVKCNYTRAGYQAMVAQKNNLLKWQTTFANGDTFVFSAFARAVPDDAENGKVRKMTVKLRTSGVMVFTPGA